MFRFTLTNRWFLGVCLFLIVLSIGCCFRYQHALAPDRQQAEEVQQKKERNQKKDVNTETTQMVTGTPGENKKTQTKDIQLNEIVSEAGKEMHLSPFGFGPYPDIPSDFPQQKLFSIHHGSPEGELLDRVRVKLWKEGIRPDGIGYLYSTGLIYPTVRGTIYVRWGEFRGKKYISSLKCHPLDFFDISKFRYENEIPPHLKVLDFSEGINPYEYLNLSKEKNK